MKGLQHTLKHWRWGLETEHWNTKSKWEFQYKSHAVGDGTVLKLIILKSTNLSTNKVKSLSKWFKWFSINLDTLNYLKFSNLKMLVVTFFHPSWVQRSNPGCEPGSLLWAHEEWLAKVNPPNSVGELEGNDLPVEVWSTRSYWHKVVLEVRGLRSTTRSTWGQQHDLTEDNVVRSVQKLSQHWNKLELFKSR